MNLSTIVAELRDFLKYLASAWGLLGLTTPLFPMVDIFADLLPVPQAHPELFALLATLCGIFALFYKFTHRHLPEEGSARTLFFAAVGVTIIYLVILPSLPEIPIEQQLGLMDLTPVVAIFLNLVKAMGSAVEPILYVAIFYLFTDAFALLAVSEYRNRYRRVY